MRAEPVRAAAGQPATETLEFGYGPYTQPNSVTSLDRLLLGFSEVDISASQRVTANHKGSLSVYQNQGAYQAGSGFAYSGGNLNISTPLLTGEAGSEITSPSVARSISRLCLVALLADGGQGAKLSFTANSLTLHTALPCRAASSNLNATRAYPRWVTVRRSTSTGWAIPFNDVTQYSWGGDDPPKSATGNIYQAAGFVHPPVGAEQPRRPTHRPGGGPDRGIGGSCRGASWAAAVATTMPVEPTCRIWAVLSISRASAWGPSAAKTPHSPLSTSA